MTTHTTTLTIDLKTQPHDGDEQAGQWVHLLPTGKFSARDGRGPWHVDDPAHIIENTRLYAGQNSLPVDYEHQIDLAAKNGQPAPAAGWIVGLKADEQGIWGLVNWTDKAVAYLKAKEYRYLSPVISYSKDGGIVRILRAALTNNPALELTALAKSQEPEESATATDLTEIKALLGLAEETSKADLIETLKTLQASSKLEGYVPLGDFKRVESELDSLRHSNEEKTALAKVEAAIHENFLPESLKEWGVSMCRHDESGFDEFLNSIKVIYGFMCATQTSRLTAEEKALLNAPQHQTPHEIFTALGHSQDDIKRYGA